MGIPVVRQIPKPGDAPITLTAATQNVEISVPARAVLMGLRAVQLSGSPQGFAVTLYERKSAADPAASNGALSADAEMYRVTDTLTVANLASSGELKQLWSYYENKDLGYDAKKVGPTNRYRKLYAHFVVTGGVVGKTFGLRLALDEPTNL
jgi:hypothetical protein